MPFTFYIITMTNMLFSNNYLEDLPKELQLSIMGEVSELDKKEKAIMDTIEMIYDKSCEGDMLYRDIESIIRFNAPNQGNKETYDNTIANIMSDDFTPTFLADSRKNYIIKKFGVFRAMFIYANMIGGTDLLKLINDQEFGDDDHPVKYSIVYDVCLVNEFQTLINEDDWDMIYKYELYDKYIESLDLEGIDTPTGFD